MRQAFRDKLEAGIAAKGIPSDKAPSWRHVTDQIGMFCYTGLTEQQVSRQGVLWGFSCLALITCICDCHRANSMQQVHRLRSEFHIYCTDDGRFSMAGINSHNIDHLVEAVLAVTV